MILAVAPQGKRTDRPSGSRPQVMTCPRTMHPLWPSTTCRARQAGAVRGRCPPAPPRLRAMHHQALHWRGVADHARAGRIGPAEPICQDVLRRRGAVQLGKSGRSDIASASGAQERCSASRRHRRASRTTSTRCRLGFGGKAGWRSLRRVQCSGRRSPDHRAVPVQPLRPGVRSREPPRGERQHRHVRGCQGHPRRPHAAALRPREHYQRTCSRPSTSTLREPASEWTPFIQADNHETICGARALASFLSSCDRNREIQKRVFPSRLQLRRTIVVGTLRL